MRRFLVAIGLASAVSLLVSSTASAAVNVSLLIGPTPPPPYSTIHFRVDGTNHPDAVRASYDGRGFVVSADREIATSGYCRNVSRTRARCLVPGVDLYGLSIELFGSGGADEILFSQVGEYPSVLGTFIDGGPGGDRLVSGSGFDLLNGGPGKDLLMSQGGPDTVRGGPGADDLRCGTRRDKYRGGPRDRISHSCEDYWYF